MLRCQSVIYIKGNQVPVETMHDSFAEIVVHAESTKHPSTAVEVYIGRSFLWLTLTV